MCEKTLGTASNTTSAKLQELGQPAIVENGTFRKKTPGERKSPRFLTTGKSHENNSNRSIQLDIALR